MWQGYFVELVILGVGLCIMLLRGLEYALLAKGGEHADNATAFHFPFSAWLGEAFSGMSTGSIETSIYLVAMLKIVISFAWMITISLNTTMGVAWHRFTAFFNIWFKRESIGRYGARRGQAADRPSGKAITLDDIDDLDEDAVARRRQGRGLLLEGHPRLHLLHRVRPLPEPVPGLEHREAALAQAAHHRPA